jgi:hypothetical protein
MDMRVEPAKEFTWRTSYDSYDFYTLPASGAK